MTKNSGKYDQLKKKILDWVNTVLEQEGWSLCFAVEFVELPLRKDRRNLANTFGWVTAN